MRGVVGRAVVAAGTAAAVLGASAGSGGGQDRKALPVLAYPPGPVATTRQNLVGQRAARTFTLVNTGGRASSALTVRLSGAAAFRITADTCRASLACRGKKCTVRVRPGPAPSLSAITATLRAVSKNRAAAATDALAGTGQGLGSAAAVYWANRGDGIDQGAGRRMISPLVSGLNQPTGVAVNGGSIYWANQGDGTIDHAPLAGTPAVPLVTGQNQLYWGGGRTAAPSTGPTRATARSWRRTWSPTG